MKSDITEDEIVDAMTAEYDVDAECARRDAVRIIEKLKSIGALE